MNPKDRDCIHSAAVRKDADSHNIIITEIAHQVQCSGTLSVTHEHVAVARESEKKADKICA